jgi:hypothetical protein
MIAAITIGNKTPEMFGGKMPSNIEFIRTSLISG